jgi:hypothetical protein
VLLHEELQRAKVFQHFDIGRIAPLQPRDQSLHLVVFRHCLVDKGPAGSENVGDRRVDDVFLEPGVHGERMCDETHGAGAGHSWRQRGLGEQRLNLSMVLLETVERVAGPNGG